MRAVKRRQSELKETQHAATRHEDYLKSIYLIGAREGTAGFGQLAHELSVSPSSVTTMLKRLSAKGLVRYTPYSGVSLTPAGESAALEVIRHHRLLESFLHRVLRYRLAEVHEEAEKLEHIISERFEDRIDEVLGRPSRDPHGSSIPARDGSMERRAHLPLTDAPVGVALEVSQLEHRNAERLGYLEEMGVVPRAIMTITERKPFSGPVTVLVGRDGEATMGHELASQIFVRTVADRRSDEP
jgi:DtxR family transcriptional regulator, Mn-dependent transcriptional regulator